MKIIELSAIYIINFRIYCELVSIVDYKKQQKKVHIERVRVISLIFWISVYMILFFTAHHNKSYILVHSKNFYTMKCFVKV
jgi:hypothetical protein